MTERVGFARARGTFLGGLEDVALLLLATALIPVAILLLGMPVVLLLRVVMTIAHHW